MATRKPPRSYLVAINLGRCLLRSWDGNHCKNFMTSTSPGSHDLLTSPWTRALLVCSHALRQSHKRKPKLNYIQAGALAGTTVDLTLYPLDTLKTRLQSSAGFRRSGGFRGVYAGVGSALIGSAPGAALFFVSYEGAKDVLRRAREGRSSGSNGRRESGWMEPLEHVIAASTGEVAACAVRVPTEVVKQRAQALQGRGSLEVLQEILWRRKKIGVRGVWMELYRGWAVTIMREVPFTVIQFPIWEALKQYRQRNTGHSSISALESGAFGSAAGAVAAALTTPLDVLKTRMMLAREKEGAWVMGRRILRESGSRAFVSGMGPRVLWISAGGAIFLGSYQWAYNELGKRDNG